ncbi:beta-lactamase family protein [Pseudoalteromonas sp. SMS1]|uniref:serine hydrolase domain-containing protein n=1 Tax=Pseudoalteromonas sp. SMS1 TaxID=2908894 RepID=UPI001F484FBF|nr:serine hydrolase [Pseudoalteromonas sp. SMS1]MCF2859159.1 beta-lactamase family protein [Pseudoalteromonas sp. SMS1]
MAMYKTVIECVTRFVHMTAWVGGALSTGAAWSNTFNAKLSDEQSDPTKLGLMVGFPPPIDKRVTQPDSNFFSFPNLRWSVCNMRALLPTARVDRHPFSATPLPYKLVEGIDHVEFTPLNSQVRLNWRESLAANYTDGILVLHKNKIVYEQYRGCLNERTNHAAMSMTKSLTGLVAEILVARGELDEHARVDVLIPELQSSAFGDTTVRQIMDMTSALKYSENYADPNADIWKYSYAANPLPKPSEYKGPVGYFEYLQTVQKGGQHGQKFGYKTVNSDVLGWIVARVTGKKFNHLLSELVWSKLGMEYSADITVDGLGTPFAGGGLSATLRDLARVGIVMLNKGKINGVQVIPASAVLSIRQGGDKRVFSAAGFKTMPNGSYRSMWWHFHNEHEAFAARGVHGQTIYIDPKAEMVIVRLSSHPVAANSAIDPTSLPAYHALAKFLIAQ